MPENIMKNNCSGNEIRAQENVCGRSIFSKVVYEIAAGVLSRA